MKKIVKNLFRNLFLLVLVLLLGIYIGNDVSFTQIMNTGLKWFYTAFDAVKNLFLSIF